jgi:uncharacterized RDD family membrane protein YckC
MLYYRQNSIRLQAALFDEANESTEFEYVGFWLRVWAGIVDSVLLMAILIPLALLIFGSSYFTSAIHTTGMSEFLVSWIFPAILIFAGWTARNQTPGKIAISAIVLDERTSAPPSIGQQCGRYLGYFLAVIPFGLGLLWIAFDPKKQGWHDKLAGTIVVRPRKKK